MSDIVSPNGTWNVDLVSAFLPATVISKILAHPAPLPHDGPDIRYWPGEGSGDSSVSLAYKNLSNFDSSLANEKWTKVWKL